MAGTGNGMANHIGIGCMGWSGNVYREYTGISKNIVYAGKGGSI